MSKHQSLDVAARDNGLKNDREKICAQGTPARINKHNTERAAVAAARNTEESNEEPINVRGIVSSVGPGPFNIVIELWRQDDTIHVRILAYPQSEHGRSDN